MLSHSFILSLVPFIFGSLKKLLQKFMFLNLSFCKYRGTKSVCARGVGGGGKDKRNATWVRFELKHYPK
jgi:hypothetical protein